MTAPDLRDQVDRRALFTRLVNAGLELQCGPLDEIGRGADNIVLAARRGNGQSVVVKIRRGACQARYGVAEWVSHQLARSNVPAPQILWHDENTCVETRVSGTPIDSAASVASRERLATEAGTILRKLHSVPVHGFGRLDASGHGREATLTAWLTRRTPDHGGGVAESSLGVRVAQALQELSPSLRRRPPGLLHGDWVARHVLSNSAIGSRGWVTGVIDLESARGGDPMADLAGWSLQEPRHLTHALLIGYGLENLAEDVRLRLVLHRLRIGTALVAHHIATASWFRARLHTQQIEADLEDLDTGRLRLTPRIAPATGSPPTERERYP